MDFVGSYTPSIATAKANTASSTAAQNNTDALLTAILNKLDGMGVYLDGTTLTGYIDSSLGGRELNARRNAANFSNEELAQAVEYCHARGVKVYITLNTLVRDDEMETAMNAVRCACDVKADALILQDIGLTSLIRRAAPDMPLHASTQTSVQTLDGIKMLADMGFCRAVLPRELSKKEIEKIAAQSPIELEMFVHGALCMCLSGQCQLSAVLGSRSGNRGLCAQPCRLPFAADGGTGHDLSLKDMSLIEYLPELAQMGVLSFKIEGRMKRPEYVAIVTRIYAAVLRENRAPTREEMQTLAKVFSRDGFTQGYLDDNIGPSMFGVRSETPDKEKSLTGEAIWIIVLDTFVAIMSGFIIFPACSSFGVSPDSGPNLIFVTLPNIFNAMPGGGRCVRGASAPRIYDAQ